jgi:hypothetical protein
MMRGLRAAASPTAIDVQRRGGRPEGGAGGAPAGRSGSPAPARSAGRPGSTAGTAPSPSGLSAPLRRPIVAAVGWPARASLVVALSLALAAGACTSIGGRARAGGPIARESAARSAAPVASASNSFSAATTPPTAAPRADQASRHAQHPATTPPSRTTPPIVVTADPGRAAAAPPASFVALSDRYAPRQGVALYDTRTSRLERYLTPEQPGGGAGYPLLDPTGLTVLYTVGAGTCASDIYRVAIAALARPQLLVRGSTGPVLAPAIEPGGGRIAYVQAHCDRTAADVVIRPLSGDGPAVALYPGGPREGISNVRWSQDGWLSFITTVGERPVLHTMSAAAGQRVHSSPAPTGCFWSNATWFSERGRVVLLTSVQCTTGSRWLVLDRHLATLRILATFPAQRGAQSLSVDATNTWLIYQENGASIAGGIWRWRFTTGDHPIAITSGPYSPSWH